MKGLILALENEEFIADLESKITRPLPENLTQLEIDIITESVEGLLSDLVDRILEKHNITCDELEHCIKNLKASKEVESHRIPERTTWPKISLPDHFDALEHKTNSALSAANAEIGHLKSELEITKEKLRHTEEYNQSLIVDR